MLSYARLSLIKCFKHDTGKHKRVVDGPIEFLLQQFIQMSTIFAQSNVYTNCLSLEMFSIIAFVFIFHSSRKSNNISFDCRFISTTYQIKSQINWYNFHLNCQLLIISNDGCCTCCLTFFIFLDQIEEGIVLYAAGGLIIEHPLVLPYIKEVVSVTPPPLSLMSPNVNHSRDGVTHLFV